MRLLCITDIHNSFSAFERILAQEPSADALILGGDLTDFGTVEDAERILDHALSHSKNLFAVAGNCDSPEIEAYLIHRKVSLHANSKTATEFGIGFLGLSAMPLWNGTMYEFSEQQLESFLTTGQKDLSDSIPKVLVSHTPPRDSGVDQTSGGQAVGSTAVQDWMLKHWPMLVICGHIHEGRGQVQIGETTVVNCGLARSGFYAVIEVETDKRPEVELKQANPATLLKP